VKLPAWSANLGTRLVKSPKVMLGDTGLLCYLLGLDWDRLQNDALMPARCWSIRGTN